MHPLTFLYGIQCSTTFTFCVYREFLAMLSPKVNLLCCFYTLSFFKDCNLWGPSTLGEIDICTHGLFCTEFNAQQLLSEAFLDVLRTFGRVYA